MRSALGVCCLIAVFLVALSGLILFVQHTNNYDDCISEKHFSAEAENNSWCIIQTLDTHNGIVTAVGTLLLVVVTAGLIQQAIRQELATQQQLRAYCMVTEARIENFAIDKIPAIQITITNCGQTPAKNFRQVATMGLDTFPPSLAPPDFTNADIVEHPLAPGKEIHVLSKLSKPLTLELIEKLTDGTAAIYIVGEINYMDAFGKKRSTNYNLFSNSLTNISQGKMGATPKGNNYK